VAEKERLTNKERRQLAREERKRKEAEAAQQAQRRRLVTALSTVLVVAVIAAVVVTAFTGGDAAIEDAIVLNSSSVDEARDAAGCEVVAEQPLDPPYTHYEPTAAPPASQLYTGPRPTNSGPHFGQQLPVIRHGTDSQLEERAIIHNLEHGSIVAWYDPEQVDGETIDEMEDWSETLFESGFVEPRTGSGIFVTPYTDPGISSGKAIALRGWGFSMDCDEWNEEVANSVVLERFGSHGIAPEGSFAPFPEDKMRYEDAAVDDTGTEEAPTGELTDEPADPDATPDPDAGAEADADETEEPGEAGTESPGDEQADEPTDASTD
jgi:hypothetical protein